jgi:effector-binding domain-containing protein
VSRFAVQLLELPGIPLAVVRRQVHRSELSRVVPECCGLVWNTLRAQQAPGGRHVAICWDGSIRLEVGVELTGPFTEQDEIVRSATPGGMVATAVHYGPYGALGSVHEAIRQWCISHGYPLAGPNWEIYEHWQPDWDADPSRIRTDVFYQIFAAQGSSTAG